MVIGILIAKPANRSKMVEEDYKGKEIYLMPRPLFLSKK